VSRQTYADNYDRIFGKTTNKFEPEHEQEGGTMNDSTCTTVRQLKKMLSDLPERLEDVPVFAHVAGEDGWAISAIKPMVGRSSEDKFVLLSTTLPDELQQYFDEELPPLRVVK
jgi:hypothetical protein